MEDSFKTLRGFVDGHEPDEPAQFAYSATLRIFGNDLNFEEITTAIGVAPTAAHRQGESPRPGSLPYRHDMWAYDPPLPENAPLHTHIDALWALCKPHREFLLEMKQRAKVDVFLGYRSNCDHVGVEVPHTSLEMFSELEMPFGISIIIT